MTTEEGNMLIADFMQESYWIADVKEWGHYHLDAKTYEEGVTEYDGFKTQFPPHECDNVEIKKVYEGSYNYLWDDLMAVVEKIENKKDKYRGDFKVCICGMGCTIQRMGFHPYTEQYLQTALGETKIEAVWTAVVEFIKWYNANIK